MSCEPGAAGVFGSGGLLWWLYGAEGGPGGEIRKASR